MENQEKLHADPNSITTELNSDATTSSTVRIKGSKVLEWCLYIIGVVLLCFAINLYLKDLDLRYTGNIYEFKEKTYVGGDAYNFMISAARSTTVMVKSLILTILACSSIIVGRLTALISR